ncbi:MAG: ATP-binding protein, partial [Akkermansia sp.]
MKRLYEHQQVLVHKRLNQDNTWWTSACIPSDYAAMSQRHYIEQFYPLVRDLSIRRAPILMGPRRVGKTVMIFHCIQQLLQEGIAARKIIYISIDTPIYSNYELEELFHLATQALSDKGEPAGYYVFFDEIQYLKDWEVHLKSLVDTYRQCKFVASGSATATLKMKSRESGAGRFSDFSLPPLTFFEYITFIKAQGLLTAGATLADWSCLDIEQLNRHFVNYINYGGYPEVVFSQSAQNNPDQFILNDIVDKVLLRDLPSLYGISDIQELNRLFMYIAFRSGSEFSYESLSVDAGLSKESLKK